MASAHDISLLERLPPVLLDLLESGEPAAFVTDSRERLVFWNSGAERLLGRRADEVVGLFCHDVLQGRDVFGNRYCQAACPVLGLARDCAPIRSFDLTVGGGNKQQPLRVLPLRRGRSFAAVGALHLYGRQGVLAQVAEQGYRLSRVY